MFCEKCGKKIDDSNKFCPYCGYKLEALPPVGYAPSPTEVTRTGAADYAPVNAEPAPKKNGGKIALIVVLVLVLLVGVVFGVLWITTDGELFSGGKQEKENADTVGVVDNTTASQATNPTAAVTTLTPDNFQEDVTCYVNVASVTLYKGPDASAYKAICTASKDDALVIKGTHSEYPEWVYVYSARTNDYGWITSALVSEQKTTELPTTDVNTNTEVIYYDVTARFDVMINVGEGHNLNLRRQPDTADPDNVILLIPDRATATVLGVSSKDSLWYYVEYTDEFATYYGYIHSDHVIRYY